MDYDTHYWLDDWCIYPQFYKTIIYGGVAVIHIILIN